MTENSGVATVNRPGAVKVGSVGMAYPSSEVKLDPATNEILTRHPAVFVGSDGFTPVMLANGSTAPI
jgi:long-chain acyl-CoA synthetase